MNLRLKLLALTFLSIISVSAQDDFISLFNGKNLDGWVEKKAHRDRYYHFFRVIDGTIMANSLNNPEHDYAWLYSEKEYSDFELKFKFRAFKTSTGNSGVQVRSRYDDEAYWMNGPQIDIHPPGPWRTGMIWDETKGNQRWIFPNIPKNAWVNESMQRKKLMFYYAEETNQWNVMRIRCVGTSIEAWLNGMKITNYEGAGVLNDETHRSLGVGMKGHIAFQIHEKDALILQLKEIFIKEL
ncbi:protein of unknown function [Sunxiuqinia elliptica]|uniref:3-keto-alpha-glucoside-1,2-lyase/3-keto-2-hydroxy-glucal hydratase domain-containing protein n=2 Tax=Sunxiuqinia elliptica TaxID=655355 RepID=A0A1I2F5G9_9BACT|nr:protein of unknown function [Sunxiuqinia elliptica]